MKMNKKLIVATAACAALLIGSISTSLAWLVDKTESVTNTFTESDINITLTETDMDENRQKSFKMVPGHKIEKDPVVTVVSTADSYSEDCYVFVKLVKKNNFDNFMTYDIGDGWTALSGNDGVYYRIVDDDGEKNVKYSVLKGDAVYVKGSVTKEMMTALSSENYPQLEITAYATQYWKNETNNEHFEADEAWHNVQDPTDETEFTSTPST